MLKYKKIFLSLFLCLIVLTGSVFATTMTQNEIISEFNEFSSTFDTFDDSDFSMTVSDQVDDLLTYYDISPSNYIYYSYYDPDYLYRFVYFYDLGSETIDSFNYSGDFGTFYLTDSVISYASYVYEDDSSGNSYNTRSVNNIFVSSVFDDGESDPYDYKFLGTTFNTIFTYSSNNIFTDSGSSGDNTLLQDLADSVSAVLSYIPVVITGLWQIVLIQFIILASLSISIIYFVIKLLKSFTGNKLNNKRFKK